MIAPISLIDVVDTRTRDSVRLLMQHLHVTGELTPFGAGLLVRHVFRPDLAKPAELVYAFMLPRDAALLGFSVVGERFRVDGTCSPPKRRWGSMRPADLAFGIHQIGGSPLPLFHPTAQTKISVRARHIRGKHGGVSYIPIVILPGRHRAPRGGKQISRTLQNKPFRAPQRH